MEEFAYHVLFFLLGFRRAFEAKIFTSAIMTALTLKLLDW